MFCIKVIKYGKKTELNASCYIIFHNKGLKDTKQRWTGWLFINKGALSVFSSGCWSLLITFFFYMTRDQHEVVAETDHSTQLSAGLFSFLFCNFIVWPCLAGGRGPVSKSCLKTSIAHIACFLKKSRYNAEVTGELHKAHFQPRVTQDSCYSQHVTVHVHGLMRVKKTKVQML